MAWGPDEQSLGRKRSTLCDGGPYDIHVFMVAGANSGHPGLPPVSLYGGAMRARSEGTVTLGPAKDWSRPVIDHAYGTDAEGHDRAVLTEALDLLREMTEQPVLARQLGEAVPREGDPLDAIATYCHPAGTCKMGPATDPDLGGRPPRRGARHPRAARRRRLDHAGHHPRQRQPAHGHDRGPRRGRPRRRLARRGHQRRCRQEGGRRRSGRPVWKGRRMSTCDAATDGPPTPFELDMRDQPKALEALVGHGIDTDTRALLNRPWGRIVLTGMGSSHYVALPTWRAVVGRGRAAWAIDTGDLLENPALLTPDTLLVATSQSGASGEMVELLDRTRGARGARAGAVVGITAVEDSPLATRADAFVALRSGAEATVSTKSYLNSLAVHHQLTQVLLGADTYPDDLERAIVDVRSVLDRDTAVGIGEHVLDVARPRTAAIGKGDSAATSLYAALITKESAKVPMEGYVGGEFRHGPYELAGPGLTAFIYAAGAPAGDTTLPTLAADLAVSGATVYSIGGPALPGVRVLDIPSDSSLSALACSAVVAEQVAVSLARANDVVPGDFVFGSKVTTAL